MFAAVLTAFVGDETDGAGAAWEMRNSDRVDVALATSDLEHLAWAVFSASMAVLLVLASAVENDHLVRRSTLKNRIVAFGGEWDMRPEANLFSTKSGRRDIGSRALDAGLGRETMPGFGPGFDLLRHRRKV